MPELANGAPKLLLAFDFGERRIGVACGDSLTGTARPLTSVQIGRSPPWPQIAALIKTWQPAVLVVGLPYNVDGSENAMTARTQRFAGELRERFGLETFSVDERYSSLDATARLAQARRSGRKGRTGKGDIDAAAACVILERWFQTHGQE
jgi:putative holliday junction resolvase